VNSNELAQSQGFSVGFQLENPEFEECREDLAIIQKADLDQSAREQINSEGLQLIAALNNEKINDLMMIEEERQVIRDSKNGLEDASSFGQQISVDGILQDRLSNLLPSYVSRKLAGSKKLSQFSGGLSSVQDIHELADEIKDLGPTSVTQALMTKEYLMILTMAFGSIIFPYFLNANWKAYATADQSGSQIVSQSWILSLLITAASLSNSSGKLGFGTMMRYFSFKWIFFTQNIIQLFTSISLTFIGTNQILYIIIICYAFVCIGANTAMFPCVCKHVFGPVVGPRVYPFVYLFFSVASLFQWAIYQYGTKDWTLLFRIFAGMTIIALVVVFFFDENPEWTERNRLYLAKVALVKKAKEVGSKKAEEPIGEKKIGVGKMAENDSLGEKRIRVSTGDKGWPKEKMRSWGFGGESVIKKDKMGDTVATGIGAD
jgi:hypothetical protein